MIVAVTNENIAQAALIHSESWKASHGFCSTEFVDAHTPERQQAYIEREMASGKSFFMLDAVGIISVDKGLIENLYVLPEAQNRGCGSRLLDYAVENCGGERLWVLNINEGARRLYLRKGFKETGATKQLSEKLWEIEMKI